MATPHAKLPRAVLLEVTKGASQKAAEMRSPPACPLSKRHSTGRSLSYQAMSLVNCTRLSMHYFLHFRGPVCILLHFTGLGEQILETFAETSGKSAKLHPLVSNNYVLFWDGHPEDPQEQKTTRGASVRRVVRGAAIGAGMKTHWPSGPGFRGSCQLVKAGGALSGQITGHLT